MQKTVWKTVEDQGAVESSKIVDTVLACDQTECKVALEPQRIRLFRVVFAKRQQSYEEPTIMASEDDLGFLAN